MHRADVLALKAAAHRLRSPRARSWPVSRRQDGARLRRRGRRGFTGAGAVTAVNDDTDASIPGRVLFQLRRVLLRRPVEQAQAGPGKQYAAAAGYRVAPVDDVEFTAQIVDVSWVHPMRASNLPGDRASPYPLVGDPDKSDVNLLFADYSGLPNSRIRFGRQAIKLDNERFVGDADVRQMPQVFDAVSVRNTSIRNTQIFAARAWHVRTYFGNRLQTDTTLLNVRHQLEIGPSVGAYSYLQDQPLIHNGTGYSDNSNRITGARLEGTHQDSSGTRWYYTAEAAQQRPYANGDTESGPITTGWRSALPGRRIQRN